MKKALKFIFLLFLQLIPIKSFSQDYLNKNLVFEQLALDYFVDSLLNKKEPFLKTKAYYDGKVDSGVTDIGWSCISEPFFKENDNRLKVYLEYLEGTMDTTIMKDPFLIEVREPIKKKYIKILAPKRNTSKLKVFQNLNFDDKNYIHISLTAKDQASGIDVFLILNQDGEIINWCYSSFLSS